MNINLFGNRTFVDIIKLTGGCAEIGWALNPAVGALLREAGEGHRERHRDTQKAM